MTSLTVMDYRPDPELDGELAGLCYAAVRGWPDQHPVSASLVRSRLRAHGMTATTLALHRDVQGRLVAAAAVRWPATLEATGQLWGPIVHPAARGGGLGAMVLDTVARIMANHPGVRIAAVEIPQARSAGWLLYERAGWRESARSLLLKRALPAGELGPPAVPVRAVRPGEYLDQALADLVAAARPQLGYALARDTYTSWTADERYTPDGLLLAEGPGGLLGAALVYPSGQQPDPQDQPGQAGPDEPAEALLAEVITRTPLDRAVAAAVRTGLVTAALRAGAASGAAVARAVVDDPDLAATLQAVGFQLVDHVRYYSPPPSRAASAPGQQPGLELAVGT